MIACSVQLHWILEAMSDVQTLLYSRFSVVGCGLVSGYASLTVLIFKYKYHLFASVLCEQWLTAK